MKEAFLVEGEGSNAMHNKHIIEVNNPIFQEALHHNLDDIRLLDKKNRLTSCSKDATHVTVI